MEAAHMFGTAVVLAGGKSSRMGFDKQLMTINNRRIIENNILKLKTLFEDIIVVSNNPGYYNLKDIRVYPDIIEGFGPLSGIYTGLTNAFSRYVYFLACDMPVVNTAYISYLMQCLSKGINEACVARRGNRIEPFNAFYSISTAKTVKEQFSEGNLSIKSFVLKLNCLYIDEKDVENYCNDSSMFLNLNTREELNAYTSVLVDEVI